MAAGDFFRNATDVLHGAAWSVFDTAVLYFPEGEATGLSLRGVFREASEEVEFEDVGPRTTVQSSIPLLDLQADELAEATGVANYRPRPRRDHVEVDGKRYVVRRIEQDGEGIYMLSLNEVGS